MKTNDTIWKMESGSGLEQKEQTEEKEIKAKNLSQFMDCLKWRYDESNDADEKKELSRQMINIGLGVQAAGLDSGGIKVKKLPDGVLGAYDRNGDEIIIASGLLNDFNSDSVLLKNVFVHEGTHKEGIADEGLCQIRTGKKVGNSPSIYVNEQESAKRTFYKMTVDRALSVYDLKHPEELINSWLELELKDMYDKKTLKRIAKSKISLEHHIKKNVDIMKGRFKKGAEKLYQKAEKKGYSMTGAIKEKLEEMSGKAMDEEKK